MYKTHNSFDSETLTSSNVELSAVGPTVQIKSSVSGSQHADVMSECDHWPNLRFLKLRISNGVHCYHMKATPRMCESLQISDENEQSSGEN